MNGGESPGPPQSARPDAEAGVTRRQFLIGGGIVVAGVAAAGAVGWRSWRVRDAWYRLSGAYGEPGTPPPAYPVTYEDGTLPSQYLAEPAAYSVAYPPGVRSGSAAALAAMPVCICLPGRGRAPGELLQGHLRFGDYVADGIETRGVTPFAVAAVQASDTYWHRREGGDDAMAMLFEEFIPFVRHDLGLGGPLAIIGWSMGGYGALRAAELHPRRFGRGLRGQRRLVALLRRRGRRRLRRRRGLRGQRRLRRRRTGSAACRCGSTAAGRTPSTRPTRRS